MSNEEKIELVNTGKEEACKVISDILIEVALERWKQRDDYIAGISELSPAGSYHRAIYTKG